MKKLIKTPLASLLVLAAFFSGNINASEALEQINAEVERTAARLDAEQGILLTSQERNNLKLSLIVNKEAAGVADLKVIDINNAIETYDITDPQDQRQLSIQFKVHVQNFSGGVEPPQ